MILDYINENNEGNFRCYKTRKFSLDDTNLAITKEPIDRSEVSSDKIGKCAETNSQNLRNIEIASEKIKAQNKSYIKYFLDGSRHVYKITDIQIGKEFFPIIAGQIVVACCKRKNRDDFYADAFDTNLVIALPDRFYEKPRKRQDYARDYSEKLRKYIKTNSRFFKERSVPNIKVLFYDTDGSEVNRKDKNRFLVSGTTKIQNEMTDCEQLLVEKLCCKNKLDDEAWLIKDGSIQYNPNFSNFDSNKWHSLRSNYKHVIGISKSFDPLLFEKEKRDIAKIISELKPYERTKVFKYRSEQSDNAYFGIWYLRLRNYDFKETPFSDIVKCELLMTDSNASFASDLIDLLSAQIIRESYPVCYGVDSRWANHLYPVYLTESFCKTKYISENIFLGLF